MKTIWFSLGAALAVLHVNQAGAQTAQARMFCFSLRFQQGTGPGGATLDLSTAMSGPANGELAPYFGVRTHASGFSLDDGFFPIDGTMYLDVPMSTDANGDGFADFFESSQSVSSAHTTGSYNTVFSTGTVQATWNRGAGSKDGSCVLTLTDSVFSGLGNYNHAFELLEYQGPLTYTPGPTTVTGAVNLARTGSPADTLRGPVAFVKSATNRFNELEVQAGAWTNGAAQSLAFGVGPFERDVAWPTNYYGLIFFDDGDPGTAGPDYDVWSLSLDDLNDSDQDGIPNFSDDPAGGPRRPVLSLARGTTNWWLTISGDVGRTNQVQEVNSMASTNWLTVLSVILTNDPQAVSLPLPAANTKFWRVKAQ